MTSMRFAQQRDHAGNADGAAADDRFDEPFRLAVGVEKAIGTRGRRRGFAAVVGDKAAALAVMEQHERAAADAARLRLDEVQHELHGNGRVDGIAALSQNSISGLDGNRIRGRDHEMPARDGRFVGPARGGFRRRALRLDVPDSKHEHERRQHAPKTAANRTVHDVALPPRTQHCR